MHCKAFFCDGWKSRKCPCTGLQDSLIHLHTCTGDFFYLDGKKCCCVPFFSRENRALSGKPCPHRISNVVCNDWDPSVSARSCLRGASDFPKKVIRNFLLLNPERWKSAVFLNPPASLSPLPSRDIRTKKNEAFHKKIPPNSYFCVGGTELRNFVKSQCDLR